MQVKSHLLHVREDYIEAAGRLPEIEALVRESAPGFVALLRHLARLERRRADTPVRGRRTSRTSASASIATSSTT